MKKFIAVLLAVVLCLSISAAAFAATTETVKTNGGTSNGAVMVKTTNNAITDPTNPDDPGYVYYVNVNWDDLHFNYTVGGTWSGATKTYSTTGWDKTTANVTVENRSNAPVNIAFKWSDEAQGTAAKTFNKVKFALSNTGTNLLPDASKTDSGLTTSCAINLDAAASNATAWSNTYTTFGTVVVSIASAV